MRAVFLAAWFTLLLAAISPLNSGPVDAHPAQPPTATKPADSAKPAIAGPVPGDPYPLGVAIPAIRAASTLMPLGLNPDGTVAVPPIEEPGKAGWYERGPGAGEAGPFVVLGHVDSHTEAGVFYRLRELRAGDQIHVDRRDGKRLTYVVDRVEHVAKDRFPTDAVYGDVPRPEIRLITCGGSFDEAQHNYNENVIVFGHLT